MGAFSQRINQDLVFTEFCLFTWIMKSCHFVFANTNNYHNFPWSYSPRRERKCEKNGFMILKLLPFLMLRNWVELWSDELWFFTRERGREGLITEDCGEFYLFNLILGWWPGEPVCKRCVTGYIRLGLEGCFAFCLGLCEQLWLFFFFSFFFFKKTERERERRIEETKPEQVKAKIDFVKARLTGNKQNQILFENWDTLLGR